MYRNKGFTLIELMIAVAIVAILASIAVPAYADYIFRSRIPPALDGLMAFGARMEQRYQDVGSYGDETCAVADQALERFNITCELTADGQGFTATAAGTGSMSTAAFSLNHNGARVTLRHPKGVPATNCWSTRGGSCDT